MADFKYKLLTTEEVAEIFKVNLRTVYRWIDAGKLRAAKIGHKTYRIYEHDVVKFINSRMVTPKNDR
ncbi:MAG: excisionase [Candidatus Buchananbacteria bacterium CG10_big_fil_rev_8_21_14_0_10_42_9]|uniref:Excisionase n=1 Tax=Candidatus Buchananbacteria bacterium CG10_big_fil_rev_8_21_14_0_10_42_9 TaxID=1974526 RepID=A0A2H0VZX0_9BACT|nr:MAG: excisionase [Candidatus Buchananbacteria bacterium CG10_big_fil_rev_8_21_14_0_10_42_9]